MSDARLTRRSLIQRGGATSAGLLGVSAVLQACGGADKPAPAKGGAPRRGGKVTWAFHQDPVYMAPFGGAPTSNHQANVYMYESLLAWDRKLNILPALAESYEATDDRTYVFKLRRGVRFHDGTELDAEDVRYSIELQRDPPPPGSAATVSQVPAIDSVDVVDKYTARINMKHADATLPGYLAWGRYSSIIPRGAYKDVDMRTEGVGSGPFKLVEYVSNDHVTFERNPRYWRPKLPYLDGITLKILTDEQARVAAVRSGAADGGLISADTAKSLESVPDLVVQSGLGAAYRVIQCALNDPSKPWADKRVRQAINHAINRQDIIDKAYGGDAQYSSVVPPGYGEWPLSDADLRERYEKFDLAKAKALMEAAGYADGFDVELQTISDTPDYVQVAQVIQQHLKAINIRVKVRPLEIGTFSKNNGEGNFDMHLTGRGMRGDVDGFVTEFAPDNAVYETWFSKWDAPPELGRLVATGKRTVDAKARPPIYTRIQQLVLDELPHIPLVVPRSYQVISQRLHGEYYDYAEFNRGLITGWVSA
jgi:peptide/nickel transport system substrate-binding protein